MLFLNRLLLLLKPKVGRAQLEKLKLLAEIWTEPSSGDQEDITRIGRKSGKHLITVEEIVSSYQNQSETFDIHMTPELDTLHPRGARTTMLESRMEIVIVNFHVFKDSVL